MITVMVATVSFAQKQQVELFSKKTTYLQVGLGVGAGYYVGSVSMPALQARFEKAVSDEVSIGAILGRASSKYTDSYGSVKYSFTLIGGRANYHFEGSDKFDAYVGGTLGYNIFSVNTEGYSSPYKGSSSAVLYGGQIGANYYFSPNIGAWAELGYGISYLNLGLTFKL